MTQSPRRPSAPSRRTVVLAGAGTAAALLTPGLATTAHAAAPAAAQPCASYWFPDSLPMRHAR